MSVFGELSTKGVERANSTNGNSVLTFQLPQHLIQMFLALVFLVSGETCWVTYEVLEGESKSFCGCPNVPVDNIANLTEERADSRDYFCFDKTSDAALRLDVYEHLWRNDNDYRPDLYIYAEDDAIVRIQTSQSEIGVCRNRYGKDVSCMGSFPRLILDKVQKIAIDNPNGNKLFVYTIDPGVPLEGEPVYPTFVSSDPAKASNEPLAHIISDKQWIWGGLLEQIHSNQVQVESLFYSMDLIETATPPKTYDTSLLPALEYSYNDEWDGPVKWNRKSLEVKPRARATVTYGHRTVTVAVTGVENPWVFDATNDDRLQMNFDSMSSLAIAPVDGLKADDLIGGTLDSYSGVRISGTWPTVAASFSYDDTTVKQNGVSVRVPQRYFSIGSSNSPLTLAGTNIPVTIYTSTLTLDAETVSVQGHWDACENTIQLKHENVVLSVGEEKAYCNEPEAITVNGGSLTVLVALCTKRSCVVSPNLERICSCVSVKDDDAYDEPFPGAALAKNGKIETQHGGIDILNAYDVVETYVQAHEHAFCEFENNIAAALWDDWKYVAEMLKMERSNLTKAIKEDLVAKFLTVHNISYSGKPTAEIFRNELPIYEFYSTAFDPIVCLNEKEQVKIDDWNLKWNPSVMYIDGDFTKYSPQMTEYGVTGVVEKGTKDGCECLGYRITKIPNSAFVPVLYMANQTLIESLSFLSDLFTIVTPSTIDQKVVLHNPTTKNVILLCFDDVPSGKSINLWDMRVDSNLIVVGLPMRAVYDGTVFNLIEKGHDSDLLKEFQPLLDKYQDYLPKVSLKIHKHDSIILCGCNYVGSSLDCDILGAFFSDVSQTSISANYVYADTTTYDTMKSKTLNNLVLVPVTKSGPDYLAIHRIEFEPGKWRLIGKGLYNSKDKPDVKYEIETSRVGQLHIISHTDDIDFAIPDKVTLSTAKAVSVVMGLNVDNMYAALPEYPLLSDNDATHKSLLKSVKGRLQSLLRPLATKATGKSAKFSGDWEQVKEIEGSFSVDAGSEPITVNEVPKNVIASLQVKSSEKSEVNLPENAEDVSLEIPLLSVVGSQDMVYGNGVKDITFNNLTFTGGRIGSVVASSISLSISGAARDIVVKNVKCSDYSSVQIDRLKLSESLEMGIGSTLNAPDGYDQQALTVSLHYTISSLADQITPSFTKLKNVPKAVKFIYDNDDLSFDMNSYVNKDLTLVSFESDCDKWLKASTFSAENPNFQGGSNVMSAKCSGQNLVLTLKKVPEPTPMPTIPEEPEDDPLNVGAIVGGVIGGLAVVAIVAIAVFILIRKKNLMKHSSTSSGDISNETASTTE